MLLARVKPLSIGSTHAYLTLFIAPVLLPCFLDRLWVMTEEGFDQLRVDDVGCVLMKSAGQLLPVLWPGVCLGGRAEVVEQYF